MAAVYALYLVRGALPPFIIAGFLSYFLEPVVTLIQKKGHSRSKAIAEVYLAFAFIALLFFLIFVPAFIEDVEGLSGQVPTFIRPSSNRERGTDIIRQYNYRKV